MIYEIVRREGEEEMARPAVSLLWSGIAAGLSISFSLVTQGVLRLHLPDAPWRPLITGFGYSVGFLLVILARQQLFTENTITAVLPVTVSFTLQNVARLIRLWTIVFAANMAGTLIAALFCSFTTALSPALIGAMLSLSAEMFRNPPVTMFFKAISAGYLIAAMVWLIPSAEGASFLVITLLTYIISIAGFAHIVAGSFESFMLIVNGQLEVSRMILGFLHTGAVRQRCRWNGAVRADLLRTGGEGGVGGGSRGVSFPHHQAPTVASEPWPQPDDHGTMTP